MPDEERESARAPRTAGELRRLIVEKGYKWTVDPRLRDGDPLPKYARGGQQNAELTIERIEGDFTEFLRQHPPSNPLVRAHWIELNLLAADRLGGTPGSTPEVASGSEEVER